MIDRSIEYKSIIMRCDLVNEEAFKEIPRDIEIEFYKKGMEYIWVDIQKSIGEFEVLTDDEVIRYFQKKFLVRQTVLEKRCIFLKDIKSKRYIGTCIAWKENKKELRVPVLHWLAVRDEFRDNGYARILITEVLKIFNKLNSGESIYLHTQPCSYKAIKIYNDFGFCITTEDTYGTAINEYVDSIKVLEKYMTKSSFVRLCETAVI